MRADDLGALSFVGEEVIDFRHGTVECTHLPNTILSYSSEKTIGYTAAKF